MNQHLHGHVTYTPINLRGDPTVNTAARHARVGCRIKPGHPIRAAHSPRRRSQANLRVESSSTSHRSTSFASRGKKMLASPATYVPSS